MGFFESNYITLFANFHKKLRELNNKRAMAEPPVSCPYEYIFYVCNKNGKTEHWASHIYDHGKGNDGMIAGIFYNMLMNEFLQLGKKEVTKEEYLTQAKDFLNDVENRILKELNDLFIDDVISID